MTDHKLTDAEIDRITSVQWEKHGHHGLLPKHCAHEFARAIEAAAQAPLLAKVAELEQTVHNLNWALGTDGYPTMATPEQQAEADAAHAETMARIAEMHRRKLTYKQLEERIAELERQAQYHRWNIEEDGDDLLICHNHHEKGEKCEYIRYTPAAEQAMQLLSAQAQAQENHERAERLERELAGVREWLPIESAPKDSTLILLRGKNDRNADGYWQPETSFTGKAHWVWPYVNREPTHWQPLPPPPTQRTEGGASD